MPIVDLMNDSEVSDILRTSLIHAITTSLSSLPPSSFPMPSTTLYSSHILPSRPAFCQKSPTPVDIKHSTHKSLTAFLRLCEKEGLLKLKEMKPDVVVVGTFPQHVDVLAHKKYESLRDVELKREEKEERAEAARNKVKEMVVKELWKPHFQTVRFFEETGNRCVCAVGGVAYIYIIHNLTKFIIAHPRCTQ
jgi:translation initiation factor 2D